MTAPQRGARVLVPLGTRTMTGLVVGEAAATDAADVKPIVEVLDDEPLPAGRDRGPRALGLGLLPGRARRRTGSRDAAGRVDGERAALPAHTGGSGGGRGRRRRRRPRRMCSRTSRRRREPIERWRRWRPRPIDGALKALERAGLIERVTAMTGPPSGLSHRAHGDADTGGRQPRGRTRDGRRDATLGAKQRAALSELAASPQPLRSATLRERGVDVGTLRRLAARGLVHLHEQVCERDPFAAGAAPDGRRATRRAR